MKNSSRKSPQNNIKKEKPKEKGNIFFNVFNDEIKKIKFYKIKIKIDDIESRQYLLRKHVEYIKESHDFVEKSIKKLNNVLNYFYDELYK